MSTSTPMLSTTTAIYDEILSTAALTDTGNETNAIDYELTNYLLIIFPFYICAVAMNFLAIYTILIAKFYRQYLSNILLAVICIGALINSHGQMFLILLRWGNNSASDQLCSSSIYLRDSGSILIHTHVLFLAVERILAHLKKQPTNLHNNLIQRAHLLLIALSLISIILAFTVPIYLFKNSDFDPFDGLCLPVEVISYKKYLNWIYFGFGHPFVWSACLLLGIYFCRKTTVTYSTLIPMNRMIMIISVSSCITILLRTLFDDVSGIGNERPLDRKDISSEKIFHLMNLRDFISIIDKLLIGLVFVLFRPEIRSWLYESMKKFQSNKKEIISPQMLDIRTELDDNGHEIDDGNLHFRTDS